MAKAKNETIEVVNLTITSPKRYEVTIRGLDAIIFNKMPDLSLSKAEKSNQEKIDKIELERMTWREKAYFNAGGSLYIPGENIHESMKEGAKYWGQRIPGEGKKTYTDVIASAVIVENLELGIKKDDEKVIPFGKNCNGNPSKGKKSGSMVYKIRPMVRPWGGSFIIHVFDGRLTVSILKTIFAFSGTFRGLCDWRPTYGRFELVEIKEI